jgi:hypothetical protein
MVDVLNSVVGAQRTEELVTARDLELIEKGRQQGWAQGRAEFVLRALAKRGIHVDEQARQRILSCRDVATLDRWFDQAWTATRLSEVLGN